MNKKLSKRETEVLFHLRKGIRAGEVAEIMQINQRTIGTYLRRVKDKLGLDLHTNLYKLIQTAIECDVFNEKNQK